MKRVQKYVLVLCLFVLNLDCVRADIQRCYENEAQGLGLLVDFINSTEPSLPVSVSDVGSIVYRPLLSGQVFVLVGGLVTTENSAMGFDGLMECDPETGVYTIHGAGTVYRPVCGPESVHCPPEKSFRLTPQLPVR